MVLSLISWVFGSRVVLFGFGELKLVDRVWSQISWTFGVIGSEKIS